MPGSANQNSHLKPAGSTFAAIKIIYSKPTRKRHLIPNRFYIFSGLRYYPYDPAYRFILPIEPLVDLLDVRINLQDDGPIRLLPIGRISFELFSEVYALTIYWFLGYGGGLFLPFKDLTYAADTFAGGRYILDTIKGADLGREGDHLGN